jgi:Na+-transporting NADH:ubiquinone oxidoreductase subunit F
MVVAGTTAPLPVERGLLARRDLAAGVRLSCQLTVRGDLRVEVPAETLGVRQWSCRVRSARSVTTLMKEIVLELPAGEGIDFRAGAYVQVTCPPHETRFDRFAIAPEYAGEWERLGLRRLAVSSARATTRAYSLANPPAERTAVTLIVRIATPPPGAEPSVPPGVVSSWLFSLAPDDPVEVTGPFGDFHVDVGEREMVFVGGGAGMAPMRSMIRDELLGRGTVRPMSFWYGARNRRELCYADEFDALATGHANFRWMVALSEPRPEDEWQGETGLIHDVLFERHLRHHPAPETCDYYLCGPPMMARAVLRLLERLGVRRERVRFDDFGA